MKIRLYTWKPDATEKVTTWSFTPLRKPKGFLIPREDTSDSNGTMARTPFSEQIILNITIPAGLLAFDEHWEQFKRMLRAHKIELLCKIGKVEQWAEFKLDEQQEISFEFVEDIDRMPRKTVKLVQAEPIYFTDFEDPKKQFIDIID